MLGTGSGFSRVRVVACFLAALLLILPAWSTLPIAQLNLHRWQRLRNAARIAPDSDFDKACRQLRSFVPQSGPIGYRNAGPNDDHRLLYFLQYSLAPRLIVESSEFEFVIEAGPEGSATSLAHDARFQIVPEPAWPVRLFRRVVR